MPGPKPLPPYEHRFFNGAGTTIHFAILPGTGPPCILLHGIGMDWRVWQAISRRLHENFTLYLVDLRGHGSSDKPVTGYSLAHYAADIEDLVDGLKLQGSVLIGSSLGAMVSIVVEADHSLISHRILVDPPLTGGPVRDERMFHDILRLKHEPATMLADYLAVSNPKASIFYLRTMSEMWHEAADGVINDVLANSQSYFDVARPLQNIDSPVLLMQADPQMGGVLNDTNAAEALALLSRGSLLKVSGAGHAIHAYKPAEFASAVTTFARRSPVESSDAQPDIE
ncbi:MAG: 2-succinyl-6-hydroxy-2,4-cyclohexadiene-1-carboxylate synthase [Chloroflexota bacterium]